MTSFKAEKGKELAGCLFFNFSQHAKRVLGFTPCKINGIKTSKWNSI